MKRQDGFFLHEPPPPHVAVEALEPGGVRLRAYFWSATCNVDLIQLQSDAKLKARVALQQAGVIAAPTGGAVGKGDVRADATNGATNGTASAVSARQAAVNLKRDARAADSATTAVDERPRDACRARPARARDCASATRGRTSWKGTRAGIGQGPVLGQP